MRYVRQYMQRTVRAEDPVIFDEMVNAIYLKAASGGKEPEIHFFEGMGLCASVRFYVAEQVPETLADKYQLNNDIHHCWDCPFFELNPDRRIKKAICHKGNKIWNDTPACDIFYEMLEGGELDEPHETRAIEGQPVLDQQTPIL